MDKIIKLLVIQIGFLFLGVFMSIPFFFLMEESVAKSYMMMSGMFLGSVFFVWYMLSKKYVCLDSWAWSFRSAKVLLLTVILSVVFFFFANSLDGLTNYLGYEYLDHKLTILRDLGHNPFGLCVLILVCPVAEELLYRGAILRLLLEKKDFAPKYAILISALIFAILHPGQNISFFFFGLLWGYLYYRSGSLSLCILSNMIVNGISALLIIYYPDARSVYEMIGTMPFIGLAVLSVILSAACIYYLNRSLSIPVWQIPENTDGESCNVVINE